MRNFVRAALVAAFVLVSGSIAQAQTSVSIGVHIGPPPPPRVVHVVEVAPEPDYVWIDGYWHPVGHRYVWHEGYWTRPPYAVFEEFEVGRGADRSIVRTDAGFGNWTPTCFELAGEQYVLEVGTSDVLRTGASHGDVWVWTRADYAERQRRRYGD